LTRAWNLIKSDVNFFFLFCCGGAINIMLLCFANYLVLWITSYVQSGVVADDAEAKTIYANVVLMIAGFGVLLIPFMGWLSDGKLTPVITIPVMFTCRFFLLDHFVHEIETPIGVEPMIISALIMVMTMSANIVVTASFLKKIPSEIRGTMNGCYSFVSLIFQSIFCVICANMIELGVEGRDFKLPFRIVRLFDLILMVWGTITAIVTFCKKV
jgi:hypothetical protein